METLKIIKVGVLHDGRLAIYPATVTPMNEYIYREAAGVYWCRDLGCFHSTRPKDWDNRKWYGQIVSVVWSGLKIKLDLAPDTQFNGASENFKADIIGGNTDVQRWIHEQECKYIQQTFLNQAGGAVSPVHRIYRYPNKP